MQPAQSEGLVDTLSHSGGAGAGLEAWCESRELSDRDISLLMAFYFYLKG